MTDVRYASRAARVMRRWRAARGPLSVRSWGRPAFLRDLPWFFAAFALLAALFVENRLLGMPGVPPLPSALQAPLEAIAGSWIVVLWAVTWIGNLALFAVLARVLGRDGGSLWVQLGKRLSRWSRRLANPWVMLTWMLVLNGLGWLTTALWLIAPPTLSPQRRLTALGFTVAMHLVAAFAVWRVLRATRLEGRARRWLCLVTAWALMAPAGVGLVAFVVSMWTGSTDRRDRTCVAVAFSRTSSASRLGRWSGAMTLVGGRWSDLPWWRRPLEPKGVPATDSRRELRGRVELLSLCRLWGLFGFFEAFAVAYALTPAVSRGDRVAGWIVAGVRTVALLVLLAGSALLVIEVVGRLAALLRLRPLRASPPIGWYAVLEAAAMVAGLSFAAGLRSADPRPLGAVVVLLGVTLAMLCGLAIMVRPVWRPESPSNLGTLLLWAAFFLVLPTVVGLALASGGDRASHAERVFVVTAATAVFVHPILGVWSLPRLLRPFVLGDLLSRSLDRLLRALLALLVIVAVMPFGGLAAPLWISARFHLLDRPDVGRRALRLHAPGEVAETVP